MQKGNQLKSCCKNSLSSREVVARDLPHPMPLSLLNRKQQPYFMREAEDPGQKISGMTPNFKGVGPVFARPARTGAPLRSGFTLIELLVVVLIIGILAAVAVPQYQKAVMRSRYATLKALAKGIADAEEAYYLANGTYTQEIDELSVDFHQTPTSVSGSTIKRYTFEGMYCEITSDNEDAGARLGCITADNRIALIIHFQHNTKLHPGDWRCSPVDSDKIANWVCAQETGGKSSDGHYWYNK